ncbi:hypothetical protein LG288_04015 [Idiomarina seosinensis]|uniref:hypothetical protein n=1 Tax=Idiomarina seosinensis TaxID=281739 RepID=UPI00384D31D3
MPRIVAKADTLDKANKQFAHQPLKQPVLLNSVPKSGTHLLRNIFRMFVANEQQYHGAFLQLPNLAQHLSALDADKPKLSWGHLLFSDNSAIATQKVRKLVIVRDPYDWVLARARFFLSDNFQGNVEHLKGGKVSVEQVLNMMIFGIHQKVPSLWEIYTHTAVSWLASDVTLVRYEDVMHHLKRLDDNAAETYFTELLSPVIAGGLPEDWRERIRVGADKKQSATYRENLDGGNFAIPSTLPAQQQAMVDYAAPQLRTILGYS